ncbi:MAG TPA: protoporphyrinogen oxidase [Candidatus Methylomirabilis sp.]|nr:protoporphyrinogen oxidase [Candidatus Methylomirabilis sp.]
MTTHVPALVVGAGISGLVCGYALRKSGIDALVVESSSRPGGLIRSERRDGYLLELGPQSFLGTQPLLDLCRELNIESELLVAPPRAPRFILVNGHLKRAPLSPSAFFASSLFNARTKWRVLRDALGHTKPPDADESIAAFVRRKFTPELLDEFVGPFVSGVYAGDPEKLSLRASFPQLHEAERSSGSIIRGMLHASKANSKSAEPKHKRPTLQSFREGNETLVKALAAKLGSSLRLYTEATSIRHTSADNPSPENKFIVSVRSEGANESIVADRLVLAAPTDSCAELLSTLHPSSSATLGTIEYAPVAVLSLGYPKAAVGHALDGFGFLAPRSEKIRTLGTVWNSSLFPGRAPDGDVLLTSFLGGATDPGAVSLSPQELVALNHKELTPILSIRQAPSFSNVQIYERALPQYNLGHLDRIPSSEQMKLLDTNLWLVGNYLRGPSIGTCAEEALSVADEIHARATMRQDRSP